MTLPTVDQLARMIDGPAFNAPNKKLNPNGERRIRRRQAAATAKAKAVHAAVAMSREPITDKVSALAAMQQRLDEAVTELFPPGSPIKWRTPNSFDQTGMVSDVSRVDGQLRIRTVDDVGHFITRITLADVLRAQS